MAIMNAAAKTYPPATVIKTKQQSKFEKLWTIDEYRKTCPGELSANEFSSQVNIPKNAECIDFGCGTGRGGLMISFQNQAIVTLVDFAENALDDDVRDITIAQPDRLKWLQADITELLPIAAPYGYCVNTLEQIPPEKVDAAIKNMMCSANHIFFQITTVEDYSKQLNKPLNLTVQPYSWWLKKFRDSGAVVHWSQSYEDKKTGDEIMCQFYISSWYSDNELTFRGSLNTTAKEVLKNIEENSKWIDVYQSTYPHALQDTEIMMICGGPSLNDYTDEIIKLRAEGMPMITSNGTYNWAIENGMQPSMQMIVDARDFNKRFLRPILDDCKYFLASQCHPSLFEDMPPERTYIFHATGAVREGAVKTETLETIEKCYGDFFPIPGGSTVTLRGLCLLRLLGFHKIHMYGFDSCLRGDAHHAYAQPENNYAESDRVPVSVGGRAFWCEPWMASQAIEWMKMVNAFGDEIDLNVVGDGLIAHMIKTGYEMVLQEEENEG
jgi:SAM-dependent methyltransferase